MQALADGLLVTCLRDGAERVIEAQVLALADGGQGALAGERTRTHDYRQCAVVCEVRCDRAHERRAYERFAIEGPMALLPAERGFALVWTLSPERAADVCALDDAAFLTALQAAFGQVRVMLGRVVARMLDDALAHLEGEVQSGELGVALLEGLDDAQGLQIMVERAAVLLHDAVQHAFTSMAERRVAGVVHQRERLPEIFVQPQHAGDGARNLRYFNGVCQPVAEVVGEARGEYLRFVL